MAYSSPDMLALIAEIFTRRASMVCGKVAQQQGLTLKQYLDLAPKHAQEGLKLVGELHQRYMKGKYEHHPRELLRIEAYCNWLIQIAHEASKQTGKPLMLQTHILESTKPCRKKMYLECIAKVHTEW